MLDVGVQRLRTAGIQCPALPHRFAQPAVVLSGAAQPHQLGGHRVERAHRADRGQELVEHHIGRVGRVIPSDRLARPRQILRARHPALPARPVPAGRSRRCTSARPHQRVLSPNALNNLRPLLDGDRRHVDAELLGELGDDGLGLRLRFVHGHLGGQRRQRQRLRAHPSDQPCDPTIARGQRVTNRVS